MHAPTTSELCLFFFLSVHAPSTAISLRDPHVRIRGNTLFLRTQSTQGNLMKWWKHIHWNNSAKLLNWYTNSTRHTTNRRLLVKSYKINTITCIVSLMFQGLQLSYHNLAEEPLTNTLSSPVIFSACFHQLYMGAPAF